MKVGFIGLGDQGGPIARRIVDGGLELMLWARRPESLLPYADTAATTAPSIAALGAGCDVVGICVYADDDVAQVGGELLPAMRPGSVILIHSTASPGLCVRLAEEGRVLGIAVLDAPVSGGNARAKTGEMTVMVGGDRAAYDRVLPLLATFAKNMAWLGKAGTGQICKLLNNAITTVHFGAALAFFDVGERLGLDRAASIGMLTSGSAQSFGLERMAEAGAEGLAFALSRLEKDVALFLDTLGEGGLDASRAAVLSRRGIDDFMAFAQGE